MRNEPCQVKETPLMKIQINEINLLIDNLFLLENNIKVKSCYIDGRDIIPTPKNEMPLSKGLFDDVCLIKYKLEILNASLTETNLHLKEQLGGE